MVFNEQINDNKTNITDAKAFNVEMNGSLFSTLSTRLYTNPIQAIIRELLSNAIDANIAAGVDEPVYVHFATHTDPEFSVTDNGIGMSDKEIMNVYASYGASSKRESNDQIGGLGLGSKTPFAYTGAFNVESSKDGVRNGYLCFLNTDGIPQIKKLFSKESEITGTKVSFIVKSEDFDSFLTNATLVFLFAQTMPKITSEDYTLRRVIGEAGCESLADFEEARQMVKSDCIDITECFSYNSLENFLTRKFSDNVILEMGGVPYEVKLSEVFDDNLNGYDFSRYIRKNKIVILHEEIGSVSIQASREKLNYTKDSIELLRKGIINTIISDFSKSYVA